LTIKQDRLRIVGVDGLIKVRWHRQLPVDSNLAHSVLSRKADKWHICFTVDLPDAQPEPRAFNPVGIDLGVTHLVALSDGTLIDAPRFTREAERVQRIHQRTLARRKRGSRGWKKARQLLRRHSERTACKRKDFLHKLTTALVHKHSHIAAEALNVKGLAGGMLAKDVFSASWGQLLLMLNYKAACAGSLIEAVDPCGTSQSCSTCGCVVKKTIAVRAHSCQHCGYEADRDVNAAQNILARASFMGPGVGLGAQSTPDVRARLAPEAVCFS
jgi:putative transposase